MEEKNSVNDVYTIRIPTINRRAGSVSPFCEACKNGVVHLSSLEVRKFTQSGKLPNVCKTCNKEFLKICRSQIRNMSEKETLHVCHLCEKTFIHAGNLKKHLGLHENPPKTVRKRKLTDPPNKEVNGQALPSVETPDGKGEEKTDFLGFENRPCICKDCKKEVSNEYAFLKHCQFHVYKKHTNACLSCNELFENTSIFKAHMLSHEEKCEYVCNICPITFVKISALKTHCIDTHNVVVKQNESPVQNIIEKPLYQCETCPKSFIQKAAYIRHCALHVSPDSFACQICEKVFTTANRLRIHISKRHENVKSPKSRKIKFKFPCKKCNRGFKTRSTYTKHKALHR